MNDIVPLHMDHKSNLTEEQKSFLDDLPVHKIVALTKTYIHQSIGGTQLRNSKGEWRHFNNSDMFEVKRYCQWLIEVGAVKYAKVNPVLPSSDPTH